MVKEDVVAEIKDRVSLTRRCSSQRESNGKRGEGIADQKLSVTRTSPSRAHSKTNSVMDDLTND
jgi:hypothetical protein